MFTDTNGAKRYTMSSDDLRTLYKKLENFIADCTLKEYSENKESINNVLTLIHKHERMNYISSKLMLVNELKAQGFDFNRSVFELSLKEKSMLADYAKQFSYHRPKNSYVGLGGAFYEHLKKLNKKL